MDGILGILISLGILPIIIKVISDRTGNWVNGFFDDYFSDTAGNLCGT